MPQITYTENGGTITYDQDDWLGGMDTTSATSSDAKMGSGLNALSVATADPLRVLGYLSPGFLATDVTNVSVVTNTLVNGVINGDNAYILSAGDSTNEARIHKLTSLSSGTLTNDATFPHTINHAHVGENGYDCVNYYVGSNLRFFYSFSDATDWDVGTYNYDGTAAGFVDNFMSTIPASPLAAPYLTGGKTNPHPLMVGDDDVLYIGDRNFLHAFDGQVGANGTFYPAVLTLPLGWTITCLAKTSDNKLAIGAYYSPSLGSSSGSFFKGQAKVWFWNYLDLDPMFSRDLHDNYISELFNWNGGIAAFTVGRRSLTQIGTVKLQVQSATGGEFEVIKTYSGSGPIRGGVENITEDLYWNDNGVINTFVKNPINGQYIFNRITSGIGTTSGMLKFFTTSYTFHASSGSTTSGGLQYFESSKYTATNTIAECRVVYPKFPPRMRGRLTEVEMVFKSAVSGGRTIQLNTALDEASGVLIDTFSTVTNLRKVAVQKRTDGSPLGDFNRLQGEIVWSTGLGSSTAPILESVIYRYININSPN
jgi:hypothetical protein